LAHGQLPTKDADGRGPRVRDTEIGEGERWRELVAGDDSGEAKGTNVLVLTSRID
jgi:hypothetical protein